MSRLNSVSSAENNERDHDRQRCLFKVQSEEHRHTEGHVIAVVANEEPPNDHHEGDEHSSVLGIPSRHVIDVLLISRIQALQNALGKLPILRKFVAGGVHGRAEGLAPIEDSIRLGHAHPFLVTTYQTCRTGQAHGLRLRGFKPTPSLAR